MRQRVVCNTRRSYARADGGEGTSPKRAQEQQHEHDHVLEAQQMAPAAHVEAIGRKPEQHARRQRRRPALRLLVGEQIDSEARKDEGGEHGSVMSEDHARDGV